MVDLTSTPRRLLAAVGCLGLLAAAWMLFSVETSSGQDASKDTPSAKAIVDKALEAHGGFKTLNKDVALIRSEESDMLIDGEKYAVKTEWQYEPPNKRAFHAIVKIGALQLNVKQGLVGDKGWVKFGPSLAVDLNPEQVIGQTWEHDNHVRNVQVLSDVDDDFTTLVPKAAKFAGRDCWQIGFTNKKNKKSVTAFFDKASGLVYGDETERVLATLAANHSREKPAKFRVEFKTFLEVGGMKMPETMTIYRENTPVVEVRKATVRVVDSIDPKVFQKPE